MGVRNSHARQSSKHTFVKHNNQLIMLATGDYQVKSILYSTKKKLLEGKLDEDIKKIKLNMPKNHRTILITCSKKVDGGLKFDTV